MTCRDMRHGFVIPTVASRPSREPSGVVLTQKVDELFPHLEDLSPNDQGLLWPSHAFSEILREYQRVTAELTRRRLKHCIRGRRHIANLWTHRARPPAGRLRLCCWIDRVFANSDWASVPYVDCCFGTTLSRKMLSSVVTRSRSKQQLSVLLMRPCILCLLVLQGLAVLVAGLS